ncbi:MAG: Response regulator protein VraR [bacterium ADurb.Bin363]|nr:MAG: Response regulator protein VraR [bacterium ADurb.Bin363]
MNPRISNEMDFILSKALKKEPQSRYQKVSEFRDNLTAIYTKYYGHDTTALLPGDEKSLQERNKIKIFLVDDDQVMRLLFKSIIKRTNDMELIGEASNGKSAIDLSKNLSPRPDVILMDINMPGLDGIETTRSILQLNPEARIIMLTALSETKVVRRAFIAGAKGYMLKGGSIKSVTEAIRKAYRGGLAIDNRISNIIEKKITKSTFKKPVFEMGSVIRLQNYSFITIMIHFSSNRATGKMLLKNSKETGEIWFKEGNIIHAVLGKLKGENAVYSFLCWEGVEVTFTMHTMPPEETIKIKKDKFITRSLRKNREMAKLRLTISSPYEIPVLNSLQEYQIVSLYDEERNLLNFIDGSKSIMEIAQDMEVSYFDIIKYVYRMVSMGLILITNRVST